MVRTVPSDKVRESARERAVCKVQDKVVGRGACRDKERERDGDKDGDKTWVKEEARVEEQKLLGTAKLDAGREKGGMVGKEKVVVEQCREENATAPCA